MREYNTGYHGPATLGSDSIAAIVQRYGKSIGTSQRYRIPYLRALTVLAESRGEIDEATHHLQEAAQLAEEIGLLEELWSIEAAIGDHHLIKRRLRGGSARFRSGG